MLAGRRSCFPCLHTTCLASAPTTADTGKFSVFVVLIFQRWPQNRQGLPGLRMRSDHGFRCLRGHFSCLSIRPFGIRRAPISCVRKHIMFPHGSRIGDPKRLHRFGLCDSQLGKSTVSDGPFWIPTLFVSGPRSTSRRRGHRFSMIMKTILFRHTSGTLGEREQSPCGFEAWSLEVCAFLRWESCWSDGILWLVCRWSFSIHLKVWLISSPGL